MANEVAHGGIGIDTNIRGLDRLEKTNNLLETIKRNTIDMHHLTANVNTKVHGLDRIKKLFHFKSGVSRDTNSNINIHANSGSIDEITHKINRLQSWLNKSHDVHMDTNNGEINKTQEAVNKLRKKVKSLNSGFKNTSDSVIGTGSSLGRFRNHLHGVDDNVRHTTHHAYRLRDAFKVAFAGGIVANMAGHVWSTGKQIVSTGYKINMAGKHAQITWSHIGLSNRQSQDMVKQMGAIKNSSDVDANSIVELQRRFYTFTGSAPQARNLTKEVVAFGKAGGESTREIDRLGRSLPRVLNGSKVRAQQFNRTFGKSPKMVQELAKASGRSKNSFLALVDSGKMTSTQLKTYMTRAAKDSGKAWGSYTNTLGGKIAAIKGIANKAQSSVTSGLTNSFTRSLTEIGNKNHNLDRVRKSVGRISQAIGTKVGNVAGKAIDFIVKNQKPLIRTGSAIFRIVKLIGSGIWKQLTDWLSIFNGRSKTASHGLNGLSNMLTRLSRHRTGLRRLGRTIAGIWVVSKVVKFTQALENANKTLGVTMLISKVAKGFRALAAGESIATVAQKGLNWAMRTNPIGLIVTAVGAVTLGLVELYKHCAPARHIMQAIGRVGLKAFKVIWNAIKAVGKLVGAVIKFEFKPYIKVFRFLGNIGSKIFHMLGGVAKGISHSAGHFIGGLTKKINGSSNSASKSTARASARSARSVHGCLSKSGKYYRHYHKGLIKMSAASYKRQERMRSRYARREQQELNRYKHNYKRYENRRSSLSRKYGKLRAMYSMKSLKVIEKRFNGLRRTITRSARRMYMITRKYFRRIGQIRWVTKQTRNLIKIWSRQRKSYAVHNRRMLSNTISHITKSRKYLNQFRKDFEDIFDDMEKNVEKGFDKFFNKLHNIAGHGMNIVQNPLNTGASHLNGFVSAFGETSAPLKRMPSISYATGTGALNGLRRPITHLTNAILNDDGHNRQETVLHPNGKVEQPKGANVHKMLEPGAEVLNATETKLMKAIGSAPIHLAGGTGFFSGIFNKIKNLFTGSSHTDSGSVSQQSLLSQAKGKGKHRLMNELQNVLKAPSKVLSGMFGDRPHSQRGLIGDIMQGAYGLGGSKAESWFSTLAGLIDKTLNQDGSSSKVTEYAMKHFANIPYSMGGTSKAAMDCSAMVQAVLNHFGVDVPRTTSAMEHSSKLQYAGNSGGGKPGQVVLWGKGNGTNGHVGLISRPGYVFNETPPYSRETPLSYITALKRNGFYNIRGLRNTGNDKLNLKTNNALQGFVKNQEAPMLKWIDKNITPMLDDNPGGSGVARWRPVIEKAGRLMHEKLSNGDVSKILTTISHESGGNPTVTQHGYTDENTGGNEAKGLVQFAKSTFPSYALSGHNRRTSGLDEILALMNDSNWRTDLSSQGGWSPSGHRLHENVPGYAKGGNFKAGDLMQVGEKGSELIKPDFSGQVLPHDESKRVVNNSHKPISVKQNITINVKDGTKDSAKKFVKLLQQYGDGLAAKLNGGMIENV